MTTVPCAPWVTAADLAGRPDITDKVVDAGVLPGAAADASNLLYMLSGRQFPGACTATLRPTAALYGCAGVYPLQAAVAAGMGIDSWMAATNGGSCCPAGLRLGLYPIRSVTQVKVNGVVQDPATYRLDDNRWLVRPGLVLWPVYQRLDLPDTAAGTFSVAVTHGQDPPQAAVSAASTLGAELAKARAGLSNRLPQRVLTLTRQGMSMTVLDPQTFIKEGLTGIYEVDLFIRGYNPAKQTRRPTVWSPDMAQHRRTG